jgi:hypothetical protein
LFFKLKIRTVKALLGSPASADSRETRHLQLVDRSRRTHRFG